MSRLLSEQIKTIPTTIQIFDDELKAKSGSSLKTIAIETAGEGAVKVNPDDLTISIIPITSGLGIIEGFSEAIRVIAVHLGFRAFITASMDIGGLIEAYDKDADAIILADDHVYVAINLNTRKVVDNVEATARGYTVAFEKMTGGLSGKEVLLIGAGRVGTKAAEALVIMGAKLIVFDINKKSERSLSARLEKRFAAKVESGLGLDEALARTPLIYDASPGQNFIRADQITEETVVASPGLPIGLRPEALQKIKSRLIHDPLQIGTAVMVYSVFS